MNSLFKISIFVALFCVIVAQKPGACPPAVGFGICVELCSDDSQCPADSKCVNIFFIEDNCVVLNPLIH